MDIKKKLFLVVTSSILAIAIPAGALLYGYAQANRLAEASTQLEEDTRGFAASVTQRFGSAEPKLRAFAHLLEKELGTPLQVGEMASFYQMADRNPDGVWRNRQPGFDGKNEAGIFIPENAGLSDLDKVRHLRTKRLMEHASAAPHGEPENLWYRSPQRSEIIFDRSYPDFAFDQKADNDYTQTPWVTLTAPQQNPKREFRFTSPWYEPLAKVWTVSALLPLYINGQWVGSLGEDLSLSSVFNSLLAKNKPYPGAQHFLLDHLGNFVLAGPWQPQLESNADGFRPDLHREPQLAALLASPLDDTPHHLGDDVTVQGTRYQAIGVRIAPLGWQYYRLTPVAPLLAPTQHLFMAAGGATLLLALLTGTLVGPVAGNSIMRRIQGQRTAMQQLEKSEELWRFALEGSDDGVWDWNVAGDTVFFSQRGQDILGLPPSVVGGVEQAWLNRIHSEDKPASLKKFQEHLSGLTPFYASEARILCKDGSYKWILNRGQVVSRSLEGHPLRVIGTYSDISDRKLAEDALRQSELNLRQSEAKIRIIFEGAADAIFVINGQGFYQYANQEASRLLGYSREHLLRMHLRDIAPSEDLPAVLLLFEKLKAAGSLRCELRLKREDGGVTSVDFNGTVLSDGSIFGACRDITKRKKAEEKLRLSASVFTHAREAIMITAMDGTIVDVNQAFTRITGYQRSDVLGKNPRILSSGRQPKTFYTDLWRDLAEQGHWYGEVWNRRKNGEVYAEMQTISTVRDAQGKPQHFVSLFSDITATKVHQQQLEHIAHFDALTNLPNRVLLADRLHQGMTQALRRGQSLAVVYLDLDGFKAINDTHGHNAGDQLLIALATRMKLALREGDTLARIGGDEFVAVLVDLTDLASCVPLLTRLLAAAAQAVQTDALSLQVSASLGVTFYPQAEIVDADQLLRQADQAMYQAKLAGKNRYHVFDAEQDRSVRGHHESLDRIRHALAQREFVLFYQPKVNMRTGVVIGAEALIRWQHPEQGLLAPAQFLPVIEDHPLAIEVGEWVIDTALTQVELWRAAGLDLPVSVNVGARQLQQADFVQRLREILAAHPQVQSSRLELEVLETSALDDVAGVSLVIQTCREMGVLFALDDFGTGYSSLTYLKRLPASLLKIDQSFVRDMLDDPDDLAILDGVIGLAAAFRREVIAEGVETVAHGQMLLQLGCELGQGYGIARPMPAEALPDWARSWKPDASWGQVPLMRRDDLPLLFACVEHQAWVKAIESHLRGERDTPPELDPAQCHFGGWMQGHGSARHGRNAGFAALDTLHRQAHGLAAELCELKNLGDAPLALGRLGELRAHTHTLLEKINLFIQHKRPLALIERA